VLDNNIATRFPDIRFIWSHGGGTMPYLGRTVQPRDGPTANRTRGSRAVQSFYYDTAQAFNSAPRASPGHTRKIPHLPAHHVSSSDYLGNAG
jgi:hypothetical protein